MRLAVKIPKDQTLARVRSMCRRGEAGGWGMEEANRAAIAATTQEDTQVKSKSCECSPVIVRDSSVR